MGLKIITSYVEKHAVIGKEVVMLYVEHDGMKIVEGEYYKRYKTQSHLFTWLPILETLQESQDINAQRILQRRDTQNAISTAMTETSQQKRGIEKIL